MLVGWFRCDLPGRWCPSACLVFSFGFFRDPWSGLFLRLQRRGFSCGWKGYGCSFLGANAGEKQARISIFLSVFDVHVNRSPIAGDRARRAYRKGKFLNAMMRASAEENLEQNVVRVEGAAQCQVVHLQDRVADCWPTNRSFIPEFGDRVERGKRVGLDQILVSRTRRNCLTRLPACR